MNVKHFLLFLMLSPLFLSAAIKEKPKVVLSVFEDKNGNFSANQISEIYHSGKFQALATPAFNPGFTSSVFWLAVKTELSDSHLKWVLSIDNPHINILEWYQTDGGRNLVLKYRTGDFFPFKQRPFPEFTTFALPLGNANFYLLKIDKRKESLQVPLRIISYNELSATYIKGNLINGLLSGTIIMMIFFSLVLWVSTTKKLYLFYGLYIGTLLLWIWSNKGLGFEYLWPNSSYFPSRARPVTLLLNVIFSIQFMQLFIGQSKKSFFYIPNKVIQVIALVFLAIAIYPTDYNQSAIKFRYTQNLLTILATLQLATLIGSVGEKIWQGAREAKFYLAAISILAISGLAEQLYMYGYIMLHYNAAQFAMLGGLALEAAILTYGLAQKFNRYRKEREALLYEKTEQQKTLTNTIVEVQEKERKIFADRLHDEIGAMLSVIGIHLDTLKKKEGLNNNSGQHQLAQADEMLAQVATTVRSMSHQISPVTIQKLGFVKALESLIQTVNKTEKLYIELVCMGFEEPDRYTQNYLNSIYRIIQELLQNIIKHSNATNGLIQLIEHDDMVVVMAEDNGKGLTPQRLQNPSGSGMNSIFSKVDYLQGKIAIETPGNGTLISIEIPIQILQATS